MWCICIQLIFLFFLFWQDVFWPCVVHCEYMHNYMSRKALTSNPNISSEIYIENYKLTCQDLLTQAYKHQHRYISRNHRTSTQSDKHHNKNITAIKGASSNDHRSPLPPGAAAEAELSLPGADVKMFCYL